MSRHKRVRMRCSRCSEEYEHKHVIRCERCGSTVDPVYDLTRVRIGEDGDSLSRYFAILPLGSKDDARGGCEPTPLVHAREAGRRYGLNQLFLKDETGHPTRTTKDRMAAVALSRLRELGVDDFVASSTGNSSTAFAYWIENFGADSLHAHLFCGAGWVSRHQHCDHDGASLHVIDGTFVKAGAAAKKFAADTGLVWEGGFFNPCRREGLKIAYLEAFDQLPREPSVVIQAVSSGMGLYGCWRGVCEYRALDRLTAAPRFVCVQQESCRPMVRSFERGSSEMLPEFIVSNPTGIAEAILRGDPTGSYPYMHRIVTETQGTFLAISQIDIEAAQANLAEDEGIRACPASAAAIAGARELKRSGWIGPDEVVLVNIAGGTRPRAIDGSEEATLTHAFGAPPTADAVVADRGTASSGLSGNV